MPDKQLILTIPEPNKDGTCNYKCPLNKYDNDNCEYNCSLLLDKKEYKGKNFPSKECPQWQSKGKWQPISGDDASMCQVCKTIIKWNQPRVCKCDII